MREYCKKDANLNISIISICYTSPHPQFPWRYVNIALHFLFGLHNRLKIQENTL